MGREIRELEERMDRMLGRPVPPSGASGGAPEEGPREVDDGQKLGGPPDLDDAPEDADATRAAERQAEDGVDGFGLDPQLERRLEPLLNALCRHYFRVRARGLENIPNTGRCLVIANHSGTVPLDGLVLRTLMRLDHPSQRSLRWLAEDFIYYVPFAGSAFSRLGAIRACQENAERLLRQEQLLVAFPEGLKGIAKLYRDRYRLQRFGRGGFVRLALRTRTPLVPCAIVGAEETAPMLHRFDYLPRMLGLPYLPVTPTFPWLGPLGLMPAPTKWRVVFGTPLSLAEYGPEAADDSVLVSELTQRIRQTIQELIDLELQQRRSVWRG